MALSLSFWLLLVTVIHVIWIPDYGEAACDSNTQFTCCGGDIECVDNTKQYDGKFDCTDGSDESLAINETLDDRGCCDRPHAFHCFSGGCVPPASILDGYNDCNNGDDSLADDEHKYIGTKCERSLDPDLCCPCDIFIDNSECVDKTGEYLCYCKSGYLSDDRGMTCTKRKFGDPCDVDPDCYDAVDNTVCPSDTKLCNCRNGWYVVNNEYCVRRILGDNCTLNTDCSDAMSNSVCEAGSCVCEFKYTPNDGSTDCNVIQVGDSCVTSPTDECREVMANSDCRDGHCVCIIGFKPSTNNSACISVIIGDNCTSDPVCRMPNSACRNGVCQCNTGYKATADGSNCYQIVLGSESCSDDSDCSPYVNNSVCTGNTCDCVIGYYRDAESTSCSKLEVGKGICTGDASCAASIPYSVCDDDLCKCIDGYYKFNGSTCDKRDVGSYCEQDDVCSENINNTYCERNERKCQCLPGYSPSDDDASCRETVVGERCQDDADCTVSVAHAECVSGRCQCLPGYAVSADKRVCTARRIGDACITDDDCTAVMPHSVCSSDTCSCPAGYLPSATNTSCNKIPIAELTCTKDSDCSAIEEGSICGQNRHCICDVPNGFYSTPDGLYCKQYKNGEAECVVNSTCTDHDSQARCIDGICDCRLGYYPKSPDMKCEIAQTRVIPCTSDSYCAKYMSGTECTGGRCECACGHYETSSGFECTKITLGESCSVLPTVDNKPVDCGCAIVNATCQNGDCMCLPGHTPNGNYTCNPPLVTASPSTSGSGCNDILKDCPWVVGVAATVCALILAAAIAVGAYMYNKHKKNKPHRAISPTTTYGPKSVKVRPISGVPVMYESDICKEPDDISDGLVMNDSSVFYTPEPTPSPVSLPAID